MCLKSITRQPHRAVCFQSHQHTAGQCLFSRSRALAVEQGIGAEVNPPYFSVKEAVFPFVKFPGVDTILGPEANLQAKSWA